jgi:NhaP-type Na+/H+ or K+/H+ antiporter
LEYFQYGLLAIGLYGVVYGIDLQALQHQKKKALIVVTLGVCFKILFIGGIFYWITGLKISWLLGAILGQIDPLSTAKLSESSKLSP